jgi:hypothetical protein
LHIFRTRGLSILDVTRLDLVPERHRPLPPCRSLSQANLLLNLCCGKKEWQEILASRMVRPVVHADLGILGGLAIPGRVGARRANMQQGPGCSTSGARASPTPNRPNQAMVQTSNPHARTVPASGTGTVSSLAAQTGGFTRRGEEITQSEHSRFVHFWEGGRGAFGF